MKWGSKPVLVIGHGLRMAGAAHLAPKLLELGIPVLTSWQAIDLVDNYHPNYFGRPGIYGQRVANKILREADHIVSIGCRLPIWMVGYEGFPWDARLTVCDIDVKEITKHPRAEVVLEDAEVFAQELISHGPHSCDEWLNQCDDWLTQWPWLEPVTHDSTDNYINSYQFLRAVESYLRPNEIIVTDMGSALIGAHQLFRLRPPQRLMTSGGLGEMGCALPAAVGASFASGKGEVLCLHCDGGMMMNLQELQTIVHHRLPIKIIVFENKGYLMIKKTQENLGFERSGVDPSSGLSCPNFRRLAQSMGIQAADVFHSSEVKPLLDQLFAAEGPALLVFHMDPEQPLWPKLNPIKRADGTIGSPDFADLSPRLK